MINVGIVGLGFMGVTHIKAYRKIEGVKVAAICDAYRLPVDGDLSQVGGNIDTDNPVKLDMQQVRAYQKLDDLLADTTIDLIDLCVPTTQHPAAAIAALRAGKHVVCEKPMARTAGLAREMVAAAETARGFLLPAMCMRFWPEWLWVKQAIADQRFGPAIAARFRRMSEPPGWSRATYFQGAESGGALLDLHIHDVDFVQYCFGRPRRVFASGLSRFSGAIDHVVAQYQLAGGAVVYAEGSWAMAEGFGFNMAYTVIFEKATADYDLARGPDALRLFETGQPPRFVRCEGEDGYVGELRHMIQSIQSGHAPDVVTPRDALSAVEICEAEEESIRTGQPVTLA